MISTVLIRTTRIDKLVVVMNAPGAAEPPRTAWPKLYCPIEVFLIEKNTLNNRFLPLPSIRTDAVLSLDDDISLEPHEIEFGYEVWRQNQELLVGWPARRHVWENGYWTYNSEFSSGYSMVLTGAAFFHRKYLEMYSFVLPAPIYKHVDAELNCEDIAFNYLVADTTRNAPLKVTGRWTFPCKLCADRKLSTSNSDGLVGHLQARSDCMHKFAQVMGYQPLLMSWSRADPVIYDGNAAEMFSDKNIFPIPAAS